jgi:predicted regulator of Ras-like GTPase activity (Roadblock/LC7/MglB family)
MSDQLPGRAARLDRALADLLAQAPELEAAAIVSFDGLAMASALPVGMNEDRVAAMSAALLSLGEKAAAGLGRGDLSQVYVEGETGTVFLVSCDEEAVLVAVAAAGAKAGLMLYEVRHAAVDIAAVLRTDAPVATTLDVDEKALADAEAAYQAYKASQLAPAPEPALAEAPAPVAAAYEAPVEPAYEPAADPLPGLVPGFEPALQQVPEPEPVVAARTYLPEPSEEPEPAVAEVPVDMPPVLVPAHPGLAEPVVAQAPSPAEPAWGPTAVPTAS